MIETIIELIKKDKIIYNIDYFKNMCLITLSTGTFSVFLQFEKSEEEEYSYLSAWITIDDESDHEHIQVETYENITTDKLHAIFYEYLEYVKLFNSNYAKLSKKFIDIEEFVNENNLPTSLVYKLFNDLELE